MASSPDNCLVSLMRMCLVTKEQGAGRRVTANLDPISAPVTARRTGRSHPKRCGDRSPRTRRSGNLVPCWALVIWLLAECPFRRLCIVDASALPRGCQRVPLCHSTSQIQSKMRRYFPCQGDETFAGRPPLGSNADTEQVDRMPPYSELVLDDAQDRWVVTSYQHGPRL